MLHVSTIRYHKILGASCAKACNAACPMCCVCEVCLVSTCLLPQLSIWSISDILKPLWAWEEIFVSQNGSSLSFLPLWCAWVWLLRFKHRTEIPSKNFVPKGPTCITPQLQGFNARPAFRQPEDTPRHQLALPSFGSSATPCKPTPTSFSIASLLAHLHSATKWQQRTYACAVK